MIKPGLRWLAACLMLCAGLPCGPQSSAVKKKAAAVSNKSRPITAKAPPGKAKAKTALSKAAATKGKAAPTKPMTASQRRAVAAEASRSSHGPQYAYRTGHGDRGIGTLKPPTRYTAPLQVPAAPVPDEAVPTVPVPVPVEPVVSGAAAIENADQLAGFFAHLQGLEQGAAGETVRALQFGDSHTAADMFTGRMRSLLQVHFGNGGAGFTFAGHPFAGYRILGTSRSESSGWVAEGVHFTQIVDTRLGMGGVANTARRPGESVTLDAPCTKMQLEYLDQQGGGGFSLLADGATLAQLSTDSTSHPAEEAGPRNAG